MPNLLVLRHKGPRTHWDLLRLGLLAAMLLLGVSTLGGCGVGRLTRGELEAPRVTLVGLTLGLPQSQGWPLTLTLRLHNPNPQELRVLGYDYEVHLEGVRVAQGNSREQVTLPAQGQQTVEFPVILKISALTELLPTLLTRPQLRYQVTGGFRLASLLGGFRVPFRFAGELSPAEGLERLRPYLYGGGG